MTVNLFFLVGLSLFAYSAGLETCGPESCNDLKTVKICKNVQYCITEVWQKNVKSGFKDNVCKICLEMVKEARDQLQSNETQTELKEVLEGSCKLLVFKPAVEMCIKLVDEFEPELVQILASQMDPETVCAVAKLCFNNELREEQLKSNECVTCQKFITSAAEVVVKSPESDFMNQLISVCRSMSSYSDACTFHLLRDPVSIINQTRLAILNQPCEHAGFCPLGATPPVEKTLSDDSTWQESKKRFCSLCPAMMGNLHSMMDEFGSDGNLMRWNYDLCTSLSFPRLLCKKFTKEFYKLLYSYFVSDVDYDYICTYGLGLCVKDSEMPPMWPLLPVTSPESFKIGEALLEEGKPLNVRVIKKKPTNRISLSVGDALPGPLSPLPVTQFLGPDAGKCLACTTVFSTISQYIGSHEDYVNSILNNTCLDSQNLEECMSFASKYGHLFKDSSHIDAERVCPSLVPFCDGKLPVLTLAANPVPEESCRFCVDVIDSLNFSSPKTESAETRVKEGLREMCEKTPVENRTLCNEIAENYLKNIVISVTSDMGGIDTCAYLKLCDESQTKDMMPVVKENNYCQSCMLVVQTVYDQLKDGNGKTEIEDILRSLCGELPSKAKGTCYLMVDMYSEELIQLILQNLTPDLICRKFHFCSSAENKHVVPVTHAGDNKVPCSFCITAIDMILNQLQNDKTEEEIRKVLHHLCSYMPSEVRDTCLTLVSQYTEDIIDMIIADFNATEICTYLKMCNSKTSEINLKSENGTSGFNIDTNEVWRKYNDRGACHFCRIMEKSMAVVGREEEGAEQMYGLLTDVCMMDSTKKFGDCADKFAKEIVPYGKKALLRMSDICNKMNICQSETPSEPLKLIQRIQNAVEECAMCEHVVEIVWRHLNLNAETYEFAQNASELCSTVPKDKQKTCRSMLTSYAPSIVYLLKDKRMDKDGVCFELKLCDESARTKVNMPVTSLEQSGLKNLDETKECLKGPSFWCANLANAKKCGTVPHCRETVWKKQKKL